MIFGKGNESEKFLFTLRILLFPILVTSQPFFNMKFYCTLLLLVMTPALWAQKTLAPLTVEKIMRDQDWIGTSPSNPYWSADGRYLFFQWNPVNALSDSLYYITLA